MNTVVRTQEGAVFEGLPGTRPLDGALVLSGPYNVIDAPNAYSFARSNTIKIDANDWTAILKKLDVPVAATNSALLRVYVETAWQLPGRAPTEA